MGMIETGLTVKEVSRGAGVSAACFLPLFEKYSPDEGMGEVTIVLTTLLALLTIPGMIYVMNF
ncbi:hypothetical protein [Bhargavaea beijingensis]|uniref:hypothetical protein n=1 Tax=Bhargavaea beijingensis TaxID=426756 RepID=UPI0022257E6C|nr:hypothetical protein [Bhargavaea beijingensis]MCW1929131.1 hypothetical protein [Bhargavaea beijingensis]